MKILLSHREKIFQYVVASVTPSTTMFIQTFTKGVPILSADNGVYILRTADKAFRVAHFTNVEDLSHALPAGFDLHPDTVLFRYSKALVFKTQDSAMKFAVKLLEDLAVCEYGICLVDTKHSWAEFVRYKGGVK